MAVGGEYSHGRRELQRVKDEGRKVNYDLWGMNSIRAKASWFLIENKNSGGLSYLLA
jgi:hypothetical protein